MPALRFPWSREPEKSEKPKKPEKKSEKPKKPEKKPKKPEKPEKKPEKPKEPEKRETDYGELLYNLIGPDGVAQLRDLGDRMTLADVKRAMVGANEHAEVDCAAQALARALAGFVPPFEHLSGKGE